MIPRSLLLHFVALPLAVCNPSMLILYFSIESQAMVKFGASILFLMLTSIFILKSIVFGKANKQREFDGQQSSFMTLVINFMIVEVLPVPFITLFLSPNCFDANRIVDAVGGSSSSQSSSGHTDHFRKVCLGYQLNFTWIDLMYSLQILVFMAIVVTLKTMNFEQMTKGSTFALK